MKEIRIKLDEPEYKRLTRAAKEELRSINKQVTIYIIRGIEADKKQGVPA